MILIPPESGAYVIGRGLDAMAYALADAGIGDTVVDRAAQLALGRETSRIRDQMTGLTTERISADALLLYELARIAEIDPAANAARREIMRMAQQELDNTGPEIPPDTLSPELLAAAGEALYGGRWQSEIARALGISDSRRVRAWMSGERSIPRGVWLDIATLLRERSAAGAAVADRIDIVCSRSS